MITFLCDGTGGIMGALPKEREERRFACAEYRSWELAEGERCELIHGLEQVFAI